MSGQHASGPLFSPLPSYTDPASSPTPASSASAPAAPSSNGTPRSDTATIMFSFVIVFLGLFGVFMMGGVAYYRWKARRRRREDGVLAMGVLDIAKLKPELWEVAISGPAAATTQPRHWEDMHPLSVAVRLKTATFPRPHKLSTASAAETLVGVAGGLILSSRHTSYCSPALNAKPSLSHRPSTLTYRTQSAQVAVLIAMPSPRSSRRRIPHPSPAAPLPHALSGVIPSPTPAAQPPPPVPGTPSEFAIGTTRVTYFADDSSMVGAG